MVLSAFILSSMLSITMKVPVLPTPALKKETKQCKRWVTDREKKKKKKKKICEVTVSSNNLISISMDVLENQFTQYKKVNDNNTDVICGVKTNQHRPNMNIWLRGNNLDIRPAVHNKWSSIRRVISSDSSPERQQGSWIFRHAMIRPHSEMKLFHFSLFPFAFLGNTQVNCSRSL